MPVFWDAREVTVTDEWLTTSHGSVRLHDLGELWITRGPRNQTALGAAGLGVALLLAAAVTAPAVPLRVAATTGVLAALTLTVAFLANWLDPPSQGLWTMLDGKVRCLFASSDQVEFGKFVRSLRRATSFAPGRCLLLRPSAPGHVTRMDVLAD